MLLYKKIKKSTASLPETQPKNSFADFFIQIALFIHLEQTANFRKGILIGIRKLYVISFKF